MSKIIVGAGSFKGFRMKPDVIEGHGNFLRHTAGPGYVAAAQKMARETRTMMREARGGRTADGDLQLVARVPDRIFLHHASRMGAPCFEDQAFLRGLLEEVPDFIVHDGVKKRSRIWGTR